MDVGVGVVVGVAVGVVVGVVVGDAKGVCVGSISTAVAARGWAVALGESEDATKPMRRPASREMLRMGMMTEARTRRTHGERGTVAFCH